MYWLGDFGPAIFEPMAFEWDERKREANLVKHAVDFVDMAALFDGATVEAVDDRRDYGETRINCLGEVEGRVYAVSYVWRARLAGSSARGKPMRENAKHITRVSSEEARRLKGKTDHARLDAMTDEDIAAASAADPDAPPLDVDWTRAPLVLPPGKDIVTLRLDRDVLDWFRAQGRGYQTRINQVLRAFYEARGHRSGGSTSGEVSHRSGGFGKAKPSRE